MGDHFNEGYHEELPVHRVCLSSFQISKTEVTNIQYKACVDAGPCIPPIPTSSDTRSSYYGNSTFNDYPVIYVDWNQAKAFCQWKGGRLPTEAEWEYAARGGLAGKRYPNGDTISCSQANYYDCGIGDTDRVGIRTPNGYGLYDMAGNVWEWVSDWYDEDYYSYSPSNDPQGPGSGRSRVLRGGSWNSDTYERRVASRYDGMPSSRSQAIGFRCVR
jgi:formylglycine-generating enzyme required for sulfatase activity